MKVALLGKKIGMTQVFDDDNRQIPVTAIEAGPCPVTQVKTAEKDGYSAVQIGFRPQKEQRLTKSERGHFKKQVWKRMLNYVNSVQKRDPTSMLAMYLQ